MTYPNDIARPIGQEYVVGFLFAAPPSIDERPYILSGPRVALIRKTRPAWQRGRLNGIGGKIEKGETPVEAMHREFAEETGLLYNEWEHLCDLWDVREDPWRVHFFYGHVSMDVLYRARSTTEERVEIVPSWPLPLDVIPNLHWLIPLALDTHIAKPVHFDNVGGF